MSGIRRRLATFLRKLADFIDPRIKPAWEQNMVVNFSCNASEFTRELDQVLKQINAVIAAAETLQPIVKGE